MANLAAVIPAAKAPLEVQEVDKHIPGKHEILVKNEVIAYQPLESKIAKLALFPIQYPAVIGMSFGGTVEAVGPAVTSLEVGNKVAAVKKRSAIGNKYGGFQRYVVVFDDCVSKVPDRIPIETPTSLIGNLGAVVGLSAFMLGSTRPILRSPRPPKKKRF